MSDRGAAVYPLGKSACRENEIVWIALTEHSAGTPNAATGTVALPMLWKTKTPSGFAGRGVMFKLN